MFALEKHPLVDCDLEEAALWYAVRDGRVAERFIASAEQAIRELGRTPLRHRERFADARRANRAGFPYAVLFVVEAETVHVLAVLHAARDHRAALERRSPAA
jgi:plasmid stabilization system protein ParE